MCISRSISSKHRPSVTDIFSQRPIPQSLMVPVKATSTSSLVKADWTKSSARPPVAHHVVQHDYHDHSHDEANGEMLPERLVARGGVTTPFPVRLHEMLDGVEAEGHSDVVSWAPHGRCFVVHKPKEFTERFLPKYFKQTKFPSFQRQLNLYGFNRLTRGPDKNGYYHELFLKNKPVLAHRIQRFKVKGTGVRARSNPEAEPNFYQMEPIGTETCDAMRTLHKTAAAPYDIVPMKVPSVVPSKVLSTTLTDHENLTETSASDMEEEDDDDTINVFGMPLHVIDPEEYEKTRHHSRPVDLDDEEMKRFMDGLGISKSLYNDILHSVSDDNEFGHLLEKVIQ